MQHTRNRIVITVYIVEQHLNVMELTDQSVIVIVVDIGMEILVEQLQLSVVERIITV
jgi:hypothetical protein